MAIPELMGYTKIAGMPVITGIYTLALPVIVFALIGSSRHLVVGADSATAAIMFAALIGIAKPASPEYVGLAGVIALLAAGYLLVARVLRLGFLADFLSRTALVGFLSGVGVQVALTQLPSMLGIHASGSVVNQMGKVLTSLGHIVIPAAVLAILAVAVILLFERRVEADSRHPGGGRRLDHRRRRPPARPPRRRHRRVGAGRAPAHRPPPRHLGPGSRAGRGRGLDLRGDPGPERGHRAQLRPEARGTPLREP